MAFTAAEIATQLVQQLRVLDPAISAEPGTPERKIIDTFASKIAEGQLDLSVLQGGLNVDSKFGTNLDRFLALFNFGRQQAVAATGFVTFSRPNSPAPQDIRIPAGSRVIAPNGAIGDVVFTTTFDVVLKQNTTSIAAPVVAVLPGASGNVAANSITQLVNVYGVYQVTNEAPITGGLSLEDDDALKTRFRNTIFRNVSGTTDQYLALAVATPFTTKANVIGPISRYREYIQVPDADDASLSGLSPDQGLYTTAMSTIPYSKYTYSGIPYFVTNGKNGAETIFLRPNADFTFNSPPLNKGDAARNAAQNPGETEWDSTDASNVYRPNATFLNVYTGADAAVQAARPGDVLLFEHSYLSSASRNDWLRNVTNCVDVFIDGGNNVVATSVVPRPTSTNLFVTDAAHRYYYQNYRRVGEAEHRPVVGNLVSQLYFQPVSALPDKITVGSVNYYRGYHYWLVEDVSELGGTVRARNAIEWSASTPTGRPAAMTLMTRPRGPGPRSLWGDDRRDGDRTFGLGHELHLRQATSTTSRRQPRARSRPRPTSWHTRPAALLQARHHCHVLAGRQHHEATPTIRAAVQSFLAGQYFGSTIQLSDLLNVIHNVSGVDNVRWSRDVPAIGGEIDETRVRVLEVNIDGTPTIGPVLDTVIYGGGTRPAQFKLYIPGAATGGTVTAHYGASSVALSYNSDSSTWAGDNTNIHPANTSAATNLRDRLRALPSSDTSLTVTGSGTVASPFLINYVANGARALTFTGALTGGGNAFNTDFYLVDDELPSLPDDAASGDSVAGLVIRPRAQSTWTRL
jgi:uncharacterized phage protein gp47/JayE